MSDENNEKLFTQTSDADIAKEDLNSTSNTTEENRVVNNEVIKEGIISCDDNTSSDESEIPEEIITTLEPTINRNHIPSDKDHTTSSSKKTAALYISFVLILIAVILIFVFLIINKLKDDKDTSKTELTNNTITADNKDNADNSNNTELPTTIAPTATPVPTASQPEPTSNPEPVVYNVEITLGNYKGIAAYYPDTSVTEEDIDIKINALLSEHAESIEITDRVAMSGDLIVIDFVGTIDGVAFSGGSANDQPLTLGSGTMIPGFEEGIIGMAIGEKKDVPVTFPANYRNSEFAGKEAVFAITLKSISVSKLPELTDDFISANTEYKTLADYRANIAEELLAENTMKADNQLRSLVLGEVIKNSTYSGDIDAEIAAYVDELKAENEESAAQMGTDALTLFNYRYGWSESQYNDYVYTQAATSVKAQYALDKIAEIEQFSVTDDNYDTFYNDLFGDIAKEDVLTHIDQETLDSYIYNYGKRKMAENYVVDNAVINE